MNKQIEYYICTEQGENLPMQYSFFLVGENEEVNERAMPSGATFENGKQVRGRIDRLKGK